MVLIAFDFFRFAAKIQPEEWPFRTYYRNCSLGKKIDTKIINHIAKDTRLEKNTIYVSTLKHHLKHKNLFFFFFF